MSTRTPFTVAIIQDGVESTADATLVATEQRIRDAHAKGAQIVCLKELFNAPYFCKKLDASRFDLAEEVTGPTVTRLRAVAKELAVVLVVPIYEKQGPGVYRNSAAVIDADGALLGVYRKMHIPHDPLFEEKYYFAPGESTAPVQPNAPGSRSERREPSRSGDHSVLVMAPVSAPCTSRAYFPSTPVV